MQRQIQANIQVLTAKEDDARKRNAQLCEIYSEISDQLRQIQHYLTLIPGEPVSYTP